jgi:hypothetical protein
MENITISLDEEMEAMLQEKRQQEGKPMSFVVRKVLQQADLNEV